MARPSTISRNSADAATLSEGTTVRGRISGDGGLSIYGTVEGDITLSGELAVGKGANVRSNITASAVTIEGDVEGTVSAESGGVHVGKGARLIGDVHSARFSLDESAEFAGNLAHSFDLPSSLGAPAASRRR